MSRRQLHRQLDAAEKSAETRLGFVGDLMRQNIRLRSERDAAVARLDLLHRSIDLVTGFPVEVDPLRPAAADAAAAV